MKYGKEGSMILGIDIGGTNIKFGVVDEAYHIVQKYMIPTAVEQGADRIVSDIIEKCKEIKKDCPFEKIGIGTPGKVDSKKGVCVRASHLPWQNTPMADRLETELGVKVCVANDATCAICGEIVAGVGRTYQDFIMITLGTGIGGGICMNGKPCFGVNGAAGEFGHMTINYDGVPCRCGGKGCFEQYASVSALIRQTEEAVEKNPESRLAKCAREENRISGKTLFHAVEAGCEVALEVLEQYTDYLAHGIFGLCKIFAPEAVVIGGAVSGQGELLLEPVRRKINLDINLAASELQNDAGIIGAAVIVK